MQLPGYRFVNASHRDLLPHLGSAVAVVISKNVTPEVKQAFVALAKQRNMNESELLGLLISATIS